MSSFQIMPALDDATEAALRASIEKHGILVPIVVDHEGNVLDGHHRLKIANELNENAIKAGGPATELYCSSCDAIVVEDEVSEVPRYECGDCGDTFSREDSSDGDSNRCPNCNKFAAKCEDTAYCGECEDELDCRLVQVFPGEVLVVVFVVDKDDLDYGSPNQVITKAVRTKLRADYPRVRFDDRLRGQVVPSLDPVEVARTLNLDRRHLGAEQRRELVASLREAGHSLRAIAGAVGVSKSQIEKDVKKVSTSGHLTVVPEVPEKVKGKDGKSYPATRPKPEPAPKKSPTGARAVAKAAQEKRAAAKARHDTKVAEARKLEGRDPELSVEHRDDRLEHWYTGYELTEHLISKIVNAGRLALTTTDLAPPAKEPDPDEYTRDEIAAFLLHDLDLSIARLVDFQRRVHEANEAVTRA
jgi:transposase-like protein